MNFRSLPVQPTLYLTLPYITLPTFLHVRFNYSLIVYSTVLRSPFPYYFNDIFLLQNTLFTLFNISFPSSLIACPLALGHTLTMAGRVQQDAFIDDSDESWSVVHLLLGSTSLRAIS